MSRKQRIAKERIGRRKKGERGERQETSDCRLKAISGHLGLACLRKGKRIRTDETKVTSYVEEVRPLKAVVRGGRRLAKIRNGTLSNKEALGYRHSLKNRCQKFKSGRRFAFRRYSLTC
jgi:hypothetical protein